MIINCAKPRRELEQIIITLQTRYVTPLFRRWLPEKTSCAEGED